MNPIQWLFDVRCLLGKTQPCGPLPSNRQAYQTCLKLAWPAVAEAVLVSLISMIDTAMVSGLGSGAISSVGITTQPKFIILSLILSLNIGVTAVVARRTGQEDRHGANRTLKQSIMLSALISIVMTLLGFLMAAPILRLAGAQKDYMETAVAYFQITLIGNFFYSISLTINAAQRGSGNTKIALKTNLMANSVNLLFNYLLIGGNFGFPALGVRGAAIATVLGNIVAFGMSFYSILGKDGYLSLFSHTRWRFDFNTLHALMKVSSGAMLDQLFMRIGFFSYAAIVARLGTDDYAVHNVCMNLINLTFSFGDGFSAAASALVGQNMGAKRNDLSYLYGKVGQRLALIVSLCLCGGLILFGSNVIEIFFHDAYTIGLGSRVVLIVAVTAPIQMTQVEQAGCLRGAGDSTYTAQVSGISSTFLRPVLSWLLCFPLQFGLVGAWFGLFFDQVLRSICMHHRFATKKWMRINL